jgi:PIN domain-containing protein
MPETDNSKRSLRNIAPGYFYPETSDIEYMLTRGLVSFDTNALFDAYRFSTPAREEFFSALTSLGPRLWVANRVAIEFSRNRLDIVREVESSLEELLADLRKHESGSLQLLRAFQNRQRLTNEIADSLADRLSGAYSGITKKLTRHANTDLSLDLAIRQDPVLCRFEALLEGKIGSSAVNEDSVRAEAARRSAEKIPPGFADSSKDSERAAGDYLVWAQLIDEARVRKEPALFVTNENKVDWVRKTAGRTLGPRPELIEEMLREAGVSFHLITVGSFLHHAKNFLDVAVSEETVSEAESIALDASSRKALATGRALAYEQHVMANIIDIFPLARIGRPDLDYGYDAFVAFPSEGAVRDSRIVNIVVKYTMHSDAVNISRRIRDWISQYGSSDSIVPTLMVTNYSLPENLGPMEAQLRRRSLRLVQWRSLDDNDDLKAAILAMISESSP